MYRRASVSSGPGVERVVGWVATTGPHEGHPEFEMPEEALYLLAGALTQGALQMLLDHDERKRVNAKVLWARVEATEDGHLGVLAEYEIPEGSTAGRTGFSVSLKIARRLVHSASPDAPTISLYADALNFDQDLVFEAADAITDQLEIRAGHLYQFNILPPAKVVLELPLTLLVDFAWAIFAASILEGLKKFLGRGKPTDFRFEVKRPDGSEVTGLLRTDDPDVAKHALDALTEITSQGTGSFEFEASADSYVELPPSDEQVRPSEAAEPRAVVPEDEQPRS
jgi:hypothetical protein